MSKKLNKNLYRALLIVTFVAVNGLIIWGISSVLAYLNTGADRSTMLHAEVINSKIYTPKINWDISAVEGRPMEKPTLQEIEDDYLKSWYVRNNSYKTNNTHGIADFYTDNARVNLHEIIKLNEAQNISIEATTLHHSPKVEFYSADGQLVVLTDEEVVEYQKVYQNEKLVTIQEDTSAYQVMMLLEDGFWRIRHLVKIPSKIKKDSVQTSSEIKIKGKKLYKNGKPFIVKGINYYPQDSPWDMFGDDFDTLVIQKDFQLIKNQGLNSVRIFIQYEDFGKAEVKPEKLKKLKKVLDIAEESKLKVVVTLFDFYGDYSVLDWTLTHRHAEAIVSSVKNHPAILAWDLKNEPDLDFESRGKENVLAWLSHLITQIKEVDQQHLLTVGWSTPDQAHLLSEKLDLVSFHYYKDLSDLEEDYSTLNEKVNKPLVLQEFGATSYDGLWNLWSNSEEAQAEYHKKMQAFLEKEQLAFMSWTLYDFKKIPTDVVGRLPWRKARQKHFGFINSRGNLKLSSNYMSY